MATANFGIPGMTISGKLNGVVYKTRNGKTYIASLPHFSGRYTERQKTSRKDFKFASKLACSLNKAAHAKDVWIKHAVSNQTAFNAIFSNAFQFVRFGNISERMYIYPAFSRCLDNSSVELEDGRIIASVKRKDILESAPSQVEFLQMSVVVYCSDPLRNDIPQYHFMNLNSNEKSISKNGTFDFNINLFGESDSGECFTFSQTELYSDYGNHDFFIAFAALDGNKYYVHHTETLSFINFK